MYSRKALSSRTRIEDKKIGLLLNTLKGALDTLRTNAITNTATAFIKICLKKSKGVWTSRSRLSRLGRIDKIRIANAKDKVKDN